MNHPLLNPGTRNFLSVALWKIRCGRVQRNDAEVDFPFFPILGEWAGWVATASWSACGEAERSCRFGGERTNGRTAQKFVASSGGRKAVASHTHSKTSRTPPGADGVATASWSACGEAERSCRFGRERTNGRTGEKFVASSEATSTLEFCEEGRRRGGDERTRWGRRGRRGAGVRDPGRPVRGRWRYGCRKCVQNGYLRLLSWPSI